MSVKKVTLFFFVVAGLSSIVISCSQEKQKETLFTKISADKSGIDFSNNITPTQELSILNYIYFYNGGGVAVGDINNDGLADIYFSANTLPNKLYLNKGNFTFEDITVKAGVAGKSGWKSGVTMADVNGDGFLDIYVSQVNCINQKGSNELYINNGNATFSEKATEYGLAHNGYSTQASFFDYDLDGDLDMYLLNQSLRATGSFGDTTLRATRDPLGGDKLFRNDANHFVDVSEAAGIYGSKLGYGLGIAVGDMNIDGYPDIYISNDFDENDYLYYNNQDGTFSERIKKSMAHTSRFSMGNDLADINNDGNLDLIVLDMQPEDEQVVKTSAGADTYDLYQYKIAAGLHHQYPRNTLQLNMGNDEFCEVAQLAGVHATDWSWSALLSDLDNDGLKDIFITNGIVKRPIDLDYFKYVSNNEVQASLTKGISPENLKLIDKMPSGNVANYAYRNKGDLAFENKSKDWGLDHEGFSNGAAYADLDNDGDLDMVVNNINEAALIYRNEATQKLSNHYLRFKLNGAAKNTQGIGTRIIVNHNGKMFCTEQMLTRGFLSSVDPVLHLGVGNHTTVDSISIIWPDHTYQVLTNVKTDQLITANQKEATLQYDYGRKSEKRLLENISPRINIKYKHRENIYNDFNREPLIPHMLSREGPDVAVGDVNNDGLDDFYVGGTKFTPGRLFIQQKDGKIIASDTAGWETVADEVGVAFFDADGDHDADLYVVTGGNEITYPKTPLLDKLYLNDGKGNFTISSGLVPEIYANGSCVKPMDYDQDGDIDLFIGSRSVPNQYGISPTSYLLENDGTGKFTDVTLQKAIGLSAVGMVTDAVWADVDKDNLTDLVVVGEWMPVSVFKNTGKQLKDITAFSGLDQSNGWWNAIGADDFDNDGDVDLVAGNLGWNTQLRATTQEPVLGYFKDFDNNGSLDKVLGYYKQNKLYPIASRDELTLQLVALKKKYVSYKNYARSTLNDIFSEKELSTAVKKRVNTFSTSYFENNGQGSFTIKSLPVDAQLAPVMAIFSADIDKDGRKDILLGGNFFSAQPAFGRYDASQGMVLLGSGDGNFDALNYSRSGLLIQGEVRDIQRIKTKDGSMIIITKNNSSLQFMK